MSNRDLSDRSPLDRSYVRQNVGELELAWNSEPATLRRLNRRAEPEFTLLGIRPRSGERSYAIGE